MNLWRGVGCKCACGASRPENPMVRSAYSVVGVEPRRNFGALNLLLFARRHILEGVTAGSDLVLSHNQRVARAQLVRQFHGTLQFSIGRHFDGVPGLADFPRKKSG